MHTLVQVLACARCGRSLLAAVSHAVSHLQCRQNEQAERKLTGIMNYTNPGAVSHNEILQMYKDYIDSEFTWKNFTVEEQAKVIVAPRSNNLLDTKRVRCWPACMFGPALMQRCALLTGGAQRHAVADN